MKYFLKKNVPMELAKTQEIPIPANKRKHDEAFEEDPDESLNEDDEEELEELIISILDRVLPAKLNALLNQRLEKPAPSAENPVNPLHGKGFVSAKTLLPRKDGHQFAGM